MAQSGKRLEHKQILHPGSEWYGSCDQHHSKHGGDEDTAMERRWALSDMPHHPQQCQQCAKGNYRAELNPYLMESFHYPRFIGSPMLMSENRQYPSQRGTEP